MVWCEEKYKENPVTFRYLYDIVCKVVYMV